MFAWLDRLPWFFVVAGVLTLGLAPYAPPHFFEKLRMLFAGTLKRPIDVFDFVFHGLPWLLLAAKAIRALAGLRGQVGL